LPAAEDLPPQPEGPGHQLAFLDFSAWNLHFLHQEADELVEDMLKRLKDQFDSWVCAGEHFYAYEPKRPEKAREVLKRASGSYLKIVPSNPEEK